MILHRLHDVKSFWRHASEKVKDLMDLHTCILSGRTFNAGASFLQLNLDDRATQAAEVLSRAARKTHDARRGKGDSKLGSKEKLKPDGSMTVHDLFLKVQISVELVELQISIKSLYHQSNYIRINCFLIGDRAMQRS